MDNESTSIAFIDYFSAFSAFLLVLIGLLIIQNHQLSTGNIISKAEFVATLEWNEGSRSDVDIWIRNPLGDVLNYRHKDVGLMTLDHDDLGTNNDEILGADGQKIKALVRRETATVRAIIPGVHVINVMLYALRENPPITVTVQVIKLNPYQIVAEKQIQLTKAGEEETVVSFNVNPDGSVSNIDTIDKISLAEIVR